MNRVIRRKLIKAKRPSRSIEQWYKCATNLDQYWKKSKREEERLRSKKKRWELRTKADWNSKQPRKI